MTSKERAQLRAKANALSAFFQIGKGGVSEGLIAQTQDALKARELIKLKVLLETSPEKPREIADSLALATGAQVMQVVGGSIILFKEIIINPITAFTTYRESHVITVFWRKVVAV